MRVAIIIPVRDNRTGLEACLKALAAAGAAAPGACEIIVVDDGSSDDSAEVARMHGARVVSSGGRGAAAARNAGLSATDADLVLFTDSDCAPEAGWIDVHTAPFRDPGVVATKGVYRSEQTETTARFVQLEYEERYRRMAARPRIDFLDTYSLAVRRLDLEAIGGFDESLPGACVEDQEMSFRLLERGEFRFVGDAIVLHRHASGPLAYARKKFRIGRGKASLLRRHPARARGDSHTPDGLRYQVALVLLALPLLLCSFFTTPAWPWCTAALTCVLSPIIASLGLLAACARSLGVARFPAAVGLVFVRGWALALGFAAGCLAPMGAPAPRLRFARPAEIAAEACAAKPAPLPGPCERTVSPR